MKRCLVFGGSGALGRVVCRTLAEQGARVAFTYHAHERSIPNCRALSMDLSSIESIHGAIDKAAHTLDGIDAFIQCAGVSVSDKTHPRLLDIDESGWDRMMDVNVKGTFFAVRHLADIMSGSGGNIVLIGSVASEKLMPAPVHFGAAKSALRGMAMAMAKELGPNNIRVNLVAPGLMNDGASKNFPDDELQEYLKHCGLKRLGNVPEVANVVAWFALHNTYVTGQSIVVDGAL
jgi:3-oxoacyl-[acyl-carrier protein] reductase